jgi:hypothetical protein
MGGGARLPVEFERLCTNRRYKWARGGGAVGEGSTSALTHTYPPFASTVVRTTAMCFQQDLHSTVQLPTSMPDQLWGTGWFDVLCVSASGFDARPQKRTMQLDRSLAVRLKLWLCANVKGV